MISGSFRLELLKMLEEIKYLKLEDFEINSDQQREKGNPKVISFININYLLNSKFRFSVKITSNVPNQTTAFKCRFCPGAIMEEEEETYGYVDAMKKSINSWLKRILEETLSLPTQRALKAQEEQIRIIKDKITAFSEEDTCFSKEEGEKIKKDLESLKEQLEQMAKSAINDKDELKKKLESIEIDIQLLSIQIESLSRNKWLNLLASRLAGYMPNVVQYLVSSGPTVIKGLLSEGDNK